MDKSLPRFRQIGEARRRWMCDVTNQRSPVRAKLQYDKNNKKPIVESEIFRH